MVAYLGREIRDKKLKKINGYLFQWLNKNEHVIAVFRATRTKPSTSGIVLTNQRILVASIIGNLKFVDEIAADDILEFTLEKGMYKAMKLYVLKKDGTKAYMGSMYKEDALAVPSFLSRMSGMPLPVVGRINIVSTKDDNILPTTIILAISGIVILFVFPPLFVPFLVGALIGLAFKRKKRQQVPPKQNLNVAGEIARLADLRKQGVLTDDEFDAKKKQLLGL